MNNLYSLPEGEAVSHASATEYEKNIPTMIKSVNLTMTTLNSDENLIGDTPLSVMEENHMHHAKFMTTVFKLNDYELLGNTLKWVLDSYRSRGFKSRYFQKEIEVWIEVIGETLDPHHSPEIIEVYEWMKGALENLEEESRDEVGEVEYPFDPMWEERKNMFFSLLVAGNSSEALSLSRSMVHDRESLEAFYTRVVTYSMYEVGALWEKGLISVAQEHLATSIVMKIMSSLYVDFLFTEKTKGKAVVTASANEYNEIGARVISDLLELDGWNSIYLGANVPNEDLIKLIVEEKPDFISISVAMSFNISNVKTLISQIRSRPDLDDVKTLVGGYALTLGGDLQEKLGADKISLSPYETIEAARSWWKEKNGF